jgi:hypothetical protein
VLKRDLRVLAAAARLLHERGDRGTSIEGIGAAVGMTGPARCRCRATASPLSFVQGYSADADLVTRHG